MEKREDIRKELNEITHGFPQKTSPEPPVDYFESFPGRILNQWEKERSHKKRKNIQWRYITTMAAILTGLCIGALLLFKQPLQNRSDDFTSLEAYQYIHDNIGEFEDLFETNIIYPADVIDDIPQEEIEEFLMEEIDGSDPEDLF